MATLKITKSVGPVSCNARSTQIQCGDALRYLQSEHRAVYLMIAAPEMSYQVKEYIVQPRFQQCRDNVDHWFNTRGSSSLPFKEE